MWLNKIIGCGGTQAVYQDNGTLQHDMAQVSTDMAQ